MSQRPWWHHAVVYQIYPRSFQDSNGDGVGDLRGIADRLDYLTWLGVDAIWLSPIFPSPMADFGYDVSDYCDVHPLFGTLADLDALIEAAHARGLKLILDFVPNHTSSEHPWFVEARKGRDSPKRDWYIWRDPAPDGGPPNNWLSLATGASAWEFDEASGQYYYHAFLPEQPDLDWRNPQVRAAMLDVLRFWLRRGVDGFRVDVIWHLMKDPAFADDPPNPDFKAGDPPFRRVQPRHSCDHPDIHDVIAEMRRVLEEFPGDRLLIGEIYLPLERLMAYYGQELEGTHLPFNFQLISASWHAATLQQLIDEYEDALPEGGWPNWVLGNHDQPRIATRVGREQAWVAAMLLLTLRGTPTLYYGDELGLENVPIPKEREQDPFGKHMPGTGQGRDPQRTPMPWSDAPFAGFSTVEPWLPLGPDWTVSNVEAQRREPASMLSLTRRLLTLRRDDSCLAVGDYRALAVDGDVLVYARAHEGASRVIALNLEPLPKVVMFRDGDLRGRILLSTHLDREGEPVGRELALRADEGVIIAVDTGGRAA